jgi:hypothetical protein
MAKHSFIGDRPNETHAVIQFVSSWLIRKFGKLRVNDLEMLCRKRGSQPFPFGSNLSKRVS